MPLDLIDKLKYLSSLVMISRVSYTPLSAVLNSGQQVRVFNLIVRFISGEYVMNQGDSGWPKPDTSTVVDAGGAPLKSAGGGRAQAASGGRFGGQKRERERPWDDEANAKKRARPPPDYKGATVLDPDTGYHDEWIVTLDFASLYPSIIRFLNLCHSTLLLSPTPALLATLRAAGVPIDAHTLDHTIQVGVFEDGSPCYAESKGTYYFVGHVAGVLPRLLKRLLDARGAVKLQLKGAKAAGDALMESIYDGLQLALKVVCNSVYGFCGTSALTGMLPCKPVAAVTTLTGRAFIEAVQAHIEGKWNGSDGVTAKVLYGDTYVLLRV